MLKYIGNLNSVRITRKAFTLIVTDECIFHDGHELTKVSIEFAIKDELKKREENARRLAREIQLLTKAASSISVIDID